MRVFHQTFVLAACSASMALGGPPEAFDRVPDDAAVTWVIPNVQQLVNDIKTFSNTVIPAAQAMNANMGLAMVQTFLDMPGMDASGSAAAVMYVNEDEAYTEPPVVVVLPVSDFGKLRDAIGATGSGPVYQAEIQSAQVYMKDIGDGFAAVGPIPELVQEFEGKSGHADAHIKMLGSSGKQVLEQCDITMVANLQVLSPQIKEGADAMKQQMGMMMMMAGPSAAQMQAGADMITSVMNALADDGQAAAVGAQMNDEGFNLDSALQFKEGSEAAKTLAEKGDSSEFLSHVPSMDFIFAYALDASTPAVQKALSQMVQAASQAGAQQQLPGLNMVDLENATGSAGAMGTVPMMGAGLFSNLVKVTFTKDAQKTMDEVKSMMSEMNGQSSNGIKINTTFEPDAVEIKGVKVSRFGMTMQPDGTGQSQAFGPASMMMPMLFGPQGGPNGFIAPVDGTVVQTLSQNTPLMEKAIDAAKNGGGIGADDVLQSVAKRLPDNRTLEVYLSVDQLMNTIGPMAAQFGAMPGFQPVEKLPPVGWGASIGEGGVFDRLHVPNEVLTWAAKFQQQMQGQQFGDQEDTDKPRF